MRDVLPAACLCLVACAAPPSSLRPDGASAPATIRVALFNVRELSTAKLLTLDEAGTGLDPQLRAAATILQRVRPDVLVINEIDHDLGAAAPGPELNARRFADAYLRTGAAPLDLPHAFAAPCNTGLLTGLDLNGDGIVSTEADRGTRTYGDDCFGWGMYPGQYAMAVLSRFPLDADGARTFQRFLWRDLPGNHLPTTYYGEDARALLRLSSKSHWDLPVDVGGTRVHLWISHPTPPGFDGPEDRNGRRNFDELAFWLAYLEDAPELVDDAGAGGGHAADAPFVLLGDLNAQPAADAPRYDGRAAVDGLLEHPRLQDAGPWLTSRGALLASGDALESGPPGFRERATAVFSGGMRIDHVMPSVELEIVGGGVFWPAPDEDPEGAALAEAASDHRLVWLDLQLPDA